MKYYLKRLLFMLLCFSSAFYHIKAQESPPLPPPPPKESNDKKTLELGGNQKILDRKIEEIQPIEVKNSTNESSNNETCKVEVFSIKSQFFTNKKSKFYHKTIEKRLNNLDLNISDEEIIAFERKHSEGNGYYLMKDKTQE